MFVDHDWPTTLSLMLTALAFIQLLKLAKSRSVADSVWRKASPSDAEKATDRL